MPVSPRPGADGRTPAANFSVGTSPRNTAASVFSPQMIAPARPHAGSERDEAEIFSYTICIEPARAIPDHRKAYPWKQCSAAQGNASQATLHGCEAVLQHFST